MTGPAAKRQGYHGPLVVLSLEEAQLAERALSPDDRSATAESLRAKVARAESSHPSFRLPTK